MKIILPLAILIFSVSISFSQSPKPTLEVNGIVREIAMQEIYPNSESAFYITYIKIELKLRNTGSVAAIFLQSNPIIDFAEIVPIDKRDNVFLAKTDGSRSSFALSDKDWEKLKKTLDKLTPPEKKNANCKLW